MMQTFNNTISVADPVEGPGGPGHPLFFDQNEAPRAEKSLWRTGPPPLSQGLCDRPPPLQWIRHCIYWRDAFLDSEDFRFWKHQPLPARVLFGTTLSGGGGGGDSTKFYTGGSAPRSNPFPLIYCFWQKRYLFQIPSIDKWYHFHIPI